jgi:hypothetical protein
VVPRPEEQTSVMSYTTAWAKAFALTAALEVLTVLLLVRLRVVLPPARDAGRAGGAPTLGVDLDSRQAEPLLRLSAVVFYANLASHPSVWFIIPSLLPVYTTMVIVAELWAVTSEAVFYWLVIPRIGVRAAAGVSLVANGCSFGLGLLLRNLTGWV